LRSPRATPEAMKAEFAGRVKDAIEKAMEAVRRAGVVSAAIVVLVLGVLYPSGSQASDARPAPDLAEARPAGNEADNPPPAHHRSGRAARTLGWVSLSLGAEAAVIAVVTSFLLLHEKSVRDDNCDAQRACSQRGLDADGTIASLVGWNTASWIVAAAATGAGAFLLLTNRSDSGRQTTIAISPNSAGVGVRLWSSF
jgi:hypothetical protein